MRGIVMDGWRALRAAAARPGFTAGVVLALGIGIGLNTAIFSLVHAVLLRSLPYEDPERLVRVWEARPRMGAESADVAAFTMDHFRAWREGNDVFSEMAAYQDASFNLTGSAEPLRVQAARVSPALFRMLGVAPLRGRTFDDEEEIPGRDRVALLSYGFWQRQFGGDGAVTGSHVQLDGESYTVVGVMPAAFRFPSSTTELWVPLPHAPARPLEPGRMVIELVPVVARLAPGVSVEQAEEAGRVFLDHFRSTRPAARRMDEGVTIHLTPLHEQLARPLRPAVLVLLGAVAMVLLIVCANVANLFLARAQRRQGEMAVRAALGAGRGRIAAQLFAESLAHAALGGALAVLVAHGALQLLPVLDPTDVPWIEEIELSRPVLAFNLGASFLTALLVGLLPAWRASRVDVVRGLKGRAAGRARGSRLRGSVATAEVAIALLLFVAAGLFVRSFITLTHTSPGYEPDGVLTFRISLPSNRYQSAAARNTFYEALADRLAALPGVVSAGFVDALPLDRERRITTFAIEGRPLSNDPMDMPRASLRVVSPSYFEAMGVPLRSGRGLERGDRAAPPVVVVNERLARRYFPAGNVLGASIRPFGEIVGVVGDVRQEGLDAEPEPEIYVDFRAIDDGPEIELTELGVAVRHRPGTEGLLESVKAAVQGLDAELPLADLRTMREKLDASVARPRLSALLLSFFAILALVLAASGVASVVSYQAAERTRESGLRMALGATRADILRLTMRDGLQILGVGLALGLAGVLGLAGTLRSLLFGIQPLDESTIVVASAVLGLSVVLASAVPARRAARMDPMVALRDE